MGDEGQVVDGAAGDDDGHCFWMRCEGRAGLISALVLELQQVGENGDYEGSALEEGGDIEARELEIGKIIC